MPVWSAVPPEAAFESIATTILAIAGAPRARAASIIALFYIDEISSRISASMSWRLGSPILADDLVEKFRRQIRSVLVGRTVRDHNR